MSKCLPGHWTILLCVMSRMAGCLELPMRYSMARAVVESWFGECYAAGFSEESLREVDPLHWGIRKAEGRVTPIAAEERENIDAALKRAFGGVVDKAVKDGPPKEWFEDGPRGKLALIVLCDQFPRNIYRKTPDAFALDHHTPELTMQLMASHDYFKLHPIERMFALLPLEHSETYEHHELCLAAFEDLIIEAEKYPQHIQTQIAQSQTFAKDHAKVVEQFGRYPHRNAVLGRQSTPDELHYLDSGAQTYGQ